MDVERSGEELLTVRETARRLGVHENTVRNWVRDGILVSARIPGARFHRFEAREVERLRQHRGSGVSSVERERRTVGPELVDGTQLHQWAVTRDAQERFPELVRRLLVATPGVTNISIRSGDGVSAPGWDGRAASVGTDPDFLPRGMLCLEFGVGDRPKTKADEDYEKRCKDPAGAVPAESVFVFMTPRRWSGAGAWESTRRAEKVFADVRVLDADDLEGWLQATPAVHHWISEHLGRRPRDAETLDRWWARFHGRTNPALPCALFLAGRDGERERLRQILAGPASVTTVQAAWRDEAIAFVYATIEAMEAEGEGLVHFPLTVSSAEVWDRIVDQPGGVTLLPLFQGADIGAAQTAGHHVVLPVGRDQVIAGEPTIELSLPARRDAGTALEAAGIASDRAYELAALARRSMASLVRTLAIDPQIARPPWSQSATDAAILAPLVLLGSWNVGGDDTHIVSRIVDEAWPLIERTLLHWRNTDDPPFIQSSAQWHVASAEQAFLVLRHALTHTTLQRWRQIAVEVLLAPDPNLDPPTDGHPTTNDAGVAHSYSPVLWRGLADSIALIGSVGDRSLSDRVTGADHTRQIVEHILVRAEQDASGRIWRSLADVLPLLAEGAPQVLLDAIHADLDQADPLLAGMFQDGDHSSWLGSSPHTGLLWALETLCWSPSFLVEAAHALARLQAVDPGGRLSNRPMESLHSVLAGWIRHTAAPLQVKVQAIERICRQEPEIGWQLLLALLPGPHVILTPPQNPRYHDWKPDDRTVTIAEWVEYIGHLVRLAMDSASADPRRWAELIGRLGSLPPVEQDRLLDALDTVADPDTLDLEQRLLLWERLRRETVRRERFSAADRSMNNEAFIRMAAIADRLESTIGAQRLGYLFDWQPDLPGIDPSDYETYMEKLLELRTHAVQQALEEASLDGVRGLAERSPVPGQLGRVVGTVIPEEMTPELLTWLDSENPKLQELAAGWVHYKLRNTSITWFRNALSRPEMTTPQRRKTLALNAPARSDVWDTLADLDQTLSDVYWESMTDIRVQPEDLERAARELLNRNRPWATVQLLSLRINRQDDECSPTSDLVKEVLNAAMTSDPRASLSQFPGTAIGRLLDYLESQGSTPETLTPYEFAFFRLLDRIREPRALFSTLRNDPSLFIDCVSRVYRGRNEPRRQPNAYEQALGTLAWDVLHAWHDLPGLNDDGTIDSEHLNNWIRTARLELAERDRADIGDERIGQILAASPPDADGTWPAEPVRDIIETIGSPSIETGIHIGVINSRGVTARDVYEGGQQERKLADRYRHWASQTAGGWPRTSRILRRLAERYEREAQQEDTEAEVTADTE